MISGDRCAVCDPKNSLIRTAKVAGGILAYRVGVLSWP